MRMIGPARELCRVCEGYDMAPIHLIIYMMITMKNMKRIMQEITYAAVVVVSDARLRTVMINTMSAMMNKKINSYIFDLLISIENSF
jgi:hypothetical protein